MCSYVGTVRSSVHVCMVGGAIECQVSTTTVNWPRVLDDETSVVGKYVGGPASLERQNGELR